MTPIRGAGGLDELRAWLGKVRPPVDSSRLWAGVDVDGVVLDNRRHWQDGLSQDLGIEPAALKQHFFRPNWSDIVSGRRPLRPALVAALTAMETSVTADELIAYWFAQDFTVHEATVELLRDLAAEPSFVLLTNQEIERAEFLRDRLLPQGCFTALISSSAVGVTKADAAFFTQVDARLGGQSPRALIDDTEANLDVAHRQGWHTFHYKM